MPELRSSCHVPGSAGCMTGPTPTGRNGLCLLASDQGLYALAAQSPVDRSHVEELAMASPDLGNRPRPTAPVTNT